jgi:hypothetical protein
MCIDASATCQAGAASIACVDNSGCGTGDVCCASLLGAATTCSAPETCLRSPGVILCRADADCPALAPHCCQSQDIAICSAQSCPANVDGVGGGDNGPGGAD